MSGWKSSCIEKKDINLFLSLKNQFEEIGCQIIEFPFFGYKIEKKISDPMHPLIWIDVFVYKQENDNLILDSDDARKLWSKEFFKLDSINNKQLYKFGNFYLWGPSNSIPYLNRVYKDWNINGYYDGLHNSPCKPDCEPKIWKLSEEDFKPL